MEKSLLFLQHQQCLKHQTTIKINSAFSFTWFVYHKHFSLSSLSVNINIKWHVNFPFFCGLCLTWITQVIILECQSSLFEQHNTKYLLFNLSLIVKNKQKIVIDNISYQNNNSIYYIESFVFMYTHFVIISQL